MNEIIVRFVAMPVTVKGMTVTDDNNDYNIYINSNIAYNEQQTAFEHEMHHVEHNHLYNSDSAKTNEIQVEERLNER